MRGQVNGKSTFRLGILGSGKGSNCLAIADACKAGAVPAEVAIVISDVAEAPILERARERDIPCTIYSTRKVSHQAG